jgi:hypothetical protein
MFCGVSLAALVFFYSGTFLNWHGVPDFFSAYLKWFRTGTGAGGHVKEEYQIGHCALLNYYWIALMVRDEWPSLVGLAFALRLAWPAPAQERYLALYGLAVLAAYSLVPYKTPWCIISILWPFSLLFGSAVVESAFLARRLTLNPAWVVVSALLLLGASLIMTLRLNFRHCTDPKEPYVYVQTLPGVALITEPVLGLAARDPKNHAMGGEIILESYYPLPWILGDFSRIGYYGRDQMPTALEGDFIVALTSQQKEVESKLRAPYLRRRFQLRDSMDECTVWFREGLFGAWFAEPGHGNVERVTPVP